MTDDRDKTGGQGNGEAAEMEAAAALDTFEGALAEVARLRDEAAQMRDRWLRAAAEAENVRRRCEREKGDYLKYATERLVRDLLPVADNLERALEHTESEGECATLHQGVELTLKGLRAALEAQGVVVVEALGKGFDPNLHEAVSVEERAGATDNEVVGQLQKGYLLKDRLLRPALVVVAKAGGAGAAAAGEDD